MKEKIKSAPLRQILMLMVLVALAAAAAIAVPPQVNIRDPSGHLNKDGYSTDAQYGSLSWTSTGCALTTPTTATVLACATHTVAGSTRGGVTCTGGTTGTCSITKPGLYRVRFAMGSITGVNSAVQTLEVFRKDGSGSFAALTVPLRASLTNLASAIPIYSLAGGGTFTVSQAEAAAVVKVELTAISDTGNFTGKNGFFEVEKVTELSPPMPQ